MLLLRQSVLYLLANATAAAFGFLSVVVLTRLVEPAAYGSYIVVMSLGTVITTIFFTWQRHAILRYQSESAADVRMSLLTGYALTLLLHPIALIALVHVFGIPWEKALAAVLLAAASACFELGQEILRARQFVPAYVRGVMVRSAASLSLCLVAIWLGAGGLGLIAAVTTSYLVSALLSARRIWAGPRAAPDRQTLFRLASYGIPITVSGAFVALTLALDRFVLYTFLGTEAVGLYGATADFVRQCAMLPAASASFALAPIAVAHLKSDPRAVTSSHLAAGAELLLAVMVPVALGLAIAAPQVAGTILGAQYREVAVQLIPILAFAFLAHTLSQQYIQLSFGLAERPKLYILHTGAIFLLNLCLMVPLVTQFGITGAAMSLLASEVGGVVVGLLLARRAFPLPLNTAALARILSAGAFMGGVCVLAQLAVDRTDALGLAVMVTAGAAAYGAAAFALNIAQVKPAAMAALAAVRRRTSVTGS